MRVRWPGVRAVRMVLVGLLLWLGICPGISFALCQDKTATGLIVLSSGGVRLEVVIFDSDDDGLPEGYLCKGEPPPLPGFYALSGGQNQIASSTYCTFAFDIWVGTSATNTLSADTDVPSALFGGDAKDTLTGDSEGDYLHGGDGGPHAGDVLDGGAGPDYVCPSLNTGDDANGHQTAHGGAGDDYVRGGPHVDYVYGDADDDIVHGGGGDDWCYGGSEDDLVSGGEGDDHVYGEAGNDVVHGGKGYDSVYGGDDDDILLLQDYFADAVMAPGDLPDGTDHDKCVYDDNTGSTQDDPTTSLSSASARSSTPAPRAP